MKTSSPFKMLLASLLTMTALSGVGLAGEDPKVADAVIPLTELRWAVEIISIVADDYTERIEPKCLLLEKALDCSADRFFAPKTLLPDSTWTNR